MIVDNIHDVDGNLLAVVVRSQPTRPGLQFFTSEQDGLQVGFISHPEGHVIEPHIHNLPTKCPPTRSEVLSVRRGLLEVQMFGVEPAHGHAATRILHAGDLIVHIQGGHAFRMITDCDIFYVKQGPYTGRADDKITF